MKKILDVNHLYPDDPQTKSTIASIKAQLARISQNLEILSKRELIEHSPMWVLEL